MGLPIPHRQRCDLRPPAAPPPITESQNIKTADEVSGPLRELTSYLAERSTQASTTLSMKRNWSGRFVVPVQYLDNSYPTPPSSENELGDSLSDSDGDSDEHLWNEGGDVGNALVESYTLPGEHRFQSLRPGLLQYSRKEVQRWMEERLSPCKRPKTSNERAQPPSSGLDNETTEYYHLACPFYASDPMKYQRCLLQDDLQSIRRVINHLRRHHMKPRYCPTCLQTFDTAVDRDQHILRRACALCHTGYVDGINEYQKMILVQRDNLGLGKTEHWQRIWTTILPTRRPPPSPYLNTGLGREVSAARDCWRMHGKSYVSNFLENLGALSGHQKDNEKAEAALCNLGLEDLLSEIIEKHSAVKKLARERGLDSVSQTRGEDELSQLGTISDDSS